MNIGKNNLQNHLDLKQKQVPHFTLRKLSVGVASVLLSTTFLFAVTGYADDANSVASTDTNAVTTGSQGAPAVSNSTNSSEENPTQVATSTITFHAVDEKTGELLPVNLGDTTAMGNPATNTGTYTTAPRNADTPLFSGLNVNGLGFAVKIPTGYNLDKITLGSLNGREISFQDFLNIKYEANDQDVYFQYLRLKDVRVTGTDENGKVLYQYVMQSDGALPSELKIYNLSGYYGWEGSEYQTVGIDVPGYTLVNTPENANGTFWEMQKDGDQYIDVHYTYKSDGTQTGGDTEFTPQILGPEINRSTQFTMKGPINKEFDVTQSLDNLRKNLSNDTYIYGFIGRYKLHFPLNKTRFGFFRYRYGKQGISVYVDGKKSGEYSVDNVDGLSGTTYDITSNVNEIVDKLKASGYRINAQSGDLTGARTIFDENYVIRASSTATLKPGDELPTGVKFTKDDYDKAVTRTIVDVDDPDHPLAVQTVKFGRTIVYDKGTGEIIADQSGEWAPTSGTWAAFTPTKDNYHLVSIDGDTTKTSVDEVTVDHTTKDKTVEVKFASNNQQVTVQIVDKDGNVLKEIPVSGMPGTSVEVPGLNDAIKTYTDKGYMVTENPVVNGKVTVGENATTVKIVVDHGTATLMPGDELPTGVKFNKDAYDKKLTRTIIDAADPEHPLAVQTVDFGRTIVYDKVTGEIIAAQSGEWSPASGTWSAFTPTKGNYHVVSIDSDPSKKTVEEVTVKPDYINSIVVVRFERNIQQVTVQIVDKGGNVLQEIPVSGMPGTSVEVPGLNDAIKTYTDKGYVVTNNPVQGGKVTVGDSDSTIKITLDHGTATLKPGDELPTGIKFTKNDYEKAITRTIIDKDDPDHPLAVQTVNFSRAIVYDKVTGEIIPDKSGDWNPETDTWAEFTPTKENYHVVSIDSDTSKKTVEAVTVKPNYISSIVVVRFERNDQSVNVKIVDEDGKVLQEIPVSGKPGDKVTVPGLEEIIKGFTDKGYKVVDDQITDGTITIGETDSDVTITMEHETPATTAQSGKTEENGAITPADEVKNTSAAEKGTTAKTEAKKLPQTGDASAITALALGSLVGMLGLGLGAKKRKN
ncbi:MAG: YSIRK-type signal peptide-containing protein [Limosilactobacillus sp.]|uniref:mucin-binding protein n=1 Tax=Limosilactobacillus sp. TaxID=2773925 RepID=UPI0026F79DBC|nr:YSIRK-type signal peptide-containing protein [Limosilactobacillus sp.]